MLLFPPIVFSLPSNITTPSLRNKQDPMASFKHHPLELKVAAVLNAMLIFYLTFSPSKSGKKNTPLNLTVGSVSVPGNNDNSSKQEKMVLGSWPPRCANKCFSCRPCMAALVASPNHRNTRSSSYQGDESYYLLAWKCKCGNKFFQP
ncbi:hypothetical protein V6N11_037958 [Hibiscus sabdariffa]|uniref:Epidermal patterning factor-like protein n=1 Tax=Hibiscus sabdariffa TaxID=183260 RepID=A0ABR2AE42_9ROSI